MDQLRKIRATVLKHRIALIAGLLISVTAFRYSVWKFAFVTPSSIPYANVALAVGVLVALLYGVYLAVFVSINNASEQPWKDKLDSFSKIAIPAAALGYFLYQAISGAFFATTSVQLEVDKSEKPTSNAVVKIRLERGDNWMVYIWDVRYGLTSKPDAPVSYMQQIRFPGSLEDSTDFKLAPKETTSTVIPIPRCKEEQYLSVRVYSSAVGWPIVSRSYASALIPGSSEQQPCQATADGVSPPPAVPPHVKLNGEGTRPAMENALYYTFSTIAQALAAAMALLAAFAMYRLKAISDECFTSAVFMEAETGGGIKVRTLAVGSHWTGVRNEIEAKVETQTYSHLKQDMQARLIRLDRLLAAHRRILRALYLSLGLTAVVIAASIGVLAYVPSIHTNAYAQTTLNAGIGVTVVCLFAYLWLVVEAFRA